MRLSLKLLCRWQQTKPGVRSGWKITIHFVHVVRKMKANCLQHTKPLVISTSCFPRAVFEETGFEGVCMAVT